MVALTTRPRRPNFGVEVVISLLSVDGCSDEVLGVVIPATAKATGGRAAPRVGPSASPRWNEKPCRTLARLTLSGDAPADVALGVFPGGVPQLAAKNCYATCSNRMAMSVQYARYGN